MRNGRQMIEALKTERPDVVISITRSRDELTPWQGPEPSEDGYTCYVWDVVARTIRHGEMIEGRASLSGSWYRDDDTSDTAQEIGGYLPQMIDQALEELNLELEMQR